MGAVSEAQYRKGCEVDSFAVDFGTCGLLGTPTIICKFLRVPEASAERLHRCVLTHLSTDSKQGQVTALEVLGFSSGFPRVT